MIVRERAGELTVVTQADHARLAADLLALLRLPGLEDHPRRAELLRAVADHDNGWWEADAAPRVDPGSGRPLEFRRVPPDLRFEIWRRGVERFADTAPYTAAMVAAHLLRLHADRRDDDAWAPELDALERRRDELLAAAERGPLELAAVELARDCRWLALGDDLSLAAATGDAAFLRSPGWRASVSTAGTTVELHLAPFPLAGASRVAFRTRRIAARRYDSDSELSLTLAAARWESVPVRLSPLV